MDQNYEDLWTSTLDLLEKSQYFSSEDMSWVYRSSLFYVQDDQAYVCYQTSITRSLLKDHQETIEDTLSDVWGQPLHVEFFSLRDKKQLMDSGLMTTPAATQTVKKEPNPLLTYSFNPSYTFDSFVEGSSNNAAYAACVAAATRNTLGSMNPLMLYGRSGLGKTHLLHAVGNFLRQEKPRTRIIYTSAMDFVSMLIRAMRTKTPNGNTVDQVTSQMLDCDVFLLDDIQYLKNQTSQEIFFEIYNKLISQGTQIIITSDIHPSNLSNLADRLISRFSSGLILSINKPGFETSKAILKKKIEGKEDEAQISDEVLDFLAMRFSKDVRDLEGSLNRVIFAATIYNPPVIDLNFATSVLQNDPQQGDEDEELSMDTIKKAVAHFYGLTPKDLNGKSRQKKIAQARHICVYLVREMLHKPYAYIGSDLGNRDHKTIASSYERASHLIQSDPLFKQAVESIQSRLK